MGLLQKLKSALGLNGTDRSAAGADGHAQAEVTVEREPSAETEQAVKGTETTTTDAQAAESPAPTEAATDEPETPAAGGAEEPAAETADNADTAEDAESATEETTPESGGVDVEEINGIGPTYAERLRGVGIDTVAALAAADVADVAEAAETSESRASDWIEQAGDH